MIDAKELRIGNTVNYRLPYGEMIPVTIGGIQPFSLIQYVGIESYYRDINDYFPIELSDEWLIKFGFEQTNDVNKSLSKEASNHVMLLSSIGKKYVVELRNVMMSGSIMLQFTVTCVHQLQNLHFALSGKELTIQP